MRAAPRVPVMLPNTSARPSGDQLKLSMSAPSHRTSSREAAGPVAAAIMIRQLPSGACLENAIWRPSGDHAGKRSETPGPGVSSTRG